MEFSSPPLQELILQLRTSNQGLNSEDAKKRLTLQKKKEKRRSRFERELRLFIKQFENPLVLLLLVAVILSGLMGEITDMVFYPADPFCNRIAQFFSGVECR
jgi:magnesium-transporting ATPase (P-type)